MHPETYKTSCINHPARNPSVYSSNSPLIRVFFLVSSILYINIVKISWLIHSFLQIQSFFHTKISNFFIKQDFLCKLFKSTRKLRVFASLWAARSGGRRMYPLFLDQVSNTTISLVLYILPWWLLWLQIAYFTSELFAY